MGTAVVLLDIYSAYLAKGQSEPRLGLCLDQDFAFCISERAAEALNDH